LSYWGLDDQVVIVTVLAVSGRVVLFLLGERGA